MAFENMKRHVGKIKNTDRRCVVVYMQIPGKEDHALVVDTDALPARYHEPLMKVLDSDEGQQKANLGDILAVRIMPDTGMDMMNTLHREGYLAPVPANLVIMYPKPNMPVPLTAITAQFAKTITTDEADVEVPTQEPVKFNPYGNAKGDADNTQMEFTARNLLIEADLLEQEAAKKRHLAHTYAPHLAKLHEPKMVVENADKKPRTRKKALSE